MKECEFCLSETDDALPQKCSVCGFPMNGTQEEKDRFNAQYEEIKVLVDEAEAALGWARFGMFWPWLSAIIMSAYYCLRPPLEIDWFISTLIISGIFLSGYFTARRKPILTLSVILPLFILLTVIGIWKMRLLLGASISMLTPLIIPAILIIMYGNALYLCRKTEKALAELRKDL